jgi:hypothetical protein
VNAYTKVAQAVVRLIAFALILTALLLNIDYLTTLFSPIPLDESKYIIVHVHTSTGWLILTAAMLLSGVILLCASRRLAESLTKDLD